MFVVYFISVSRVRMLQFRPSEFSDLHRILLSLYALSVKGLCLASCLAAYAARLPVLAYRLIMLSWSASLHLSPTSQQLTDHDTTHRLLPDHPRRYYSTHRDSLSRCGFIFSYSCSFFLHCYIIAPSDSFIAVSDF